GHNDFAERANNWGISRTLGHAYLVTGDEKYAKAADEVYRQWMLDNPAPLQPDIEWFNRAYSGLQTIRKEGGNAYYYYGQLIRSKSLSTDTRAAFIHFQHQLNEVIRTAATSEKPEGWGGNWGFQTYSSLMNAGLEFPQFAESKQWVE